MIIAATGHRPDKLGGYNAATTLKTVRLATWYLEQHKPSLVISGMAQGWDMGVAQAAMNLGIPFDAYIPFEGQQQVWPQSTQLYYHLLLKKANRVKVCSPGRYSIQAMHVRNRAMVDACDFMLVLWDGSPGGTGHCVSYIHEVDKPYTNLWNRFREENQYQEEDVPF